MLKMKSLSILLSTMALAGATLAQTSVTIELSPTRDGTLIEDSTGQLANGIGRFIYAGSTNQAAGQRLRRALVHFDVAGSVPPGSTITDATLRCDVNRNRWAVGEDATLHRVTTDWGQGNSVGDAQGVQAKLNDATWLFTFWPDQSWTNPGGDFDATAVATTQTSGSGSTALWSSPGLIASVQDFLDNPAANYGWMIRGNEVEQRNAVSFGSREENNPDNWPTLIITFTPVACSPADITTDGTSNGIADNAITLSDFSFYLALWAASDPAADVTASGSCVFGSGGDGVDLSDFACYLSEWSFGCP